jgi:lipopolysaccharide biosynthesis glycosyltransferase
MASETKPCAFVTLFMKNPHYVYGVLVMGHSLRLTKTKHQITCMVTEDLYDDYHEVLETIYDKVFKIPYIRHTGNPLISKRQETMYGAWKNESFTKWQCLNLTDYSKICFLDADLIIVQNIDHLFDLNTPAACFQNYWCDFGNSKPLKNYYKGSKYGDKLRVSSIRRGLEQGYVLTAHCVVLEPSMDLYDGFVNYMNNCYRSFTKCISMVDESSLTHYMIETNHTWHQMDYTYNTIPWHIGKTNVERPKSLTQSTFNPPKILHYFNKEKPWIMPRGKWVDIEIWWQYYDSMKKNITVGKFHNIFENLENFNATPKTICPYCKFIRMIPSMRHTRHKHSMIVDGKIICPNLS